MRDLHRTWGQRPELSTRVAVLSFAALLLCSCAGVSVRGDWQEGVAHQSFSRLLLVGVSPDYNLRCAFENTFASQLRSPATAVFSSCDSMGPKEPLTRENIERVVALVHADAVLATRLVSSSTDERSGGTWDTRGTSLYKPIDNGFGPYGLPVTYVDFETAPPLGNIQRTLHVVTKLYGAGDARLLYTLDTSMKAQNIDSTQATMLTITAPTANQLRRAGLIR